MPHVCDDAHPELCIKSDGSYCPTWERRIGVKWCKQWRDFPADPVFIVASLDRHAA